ncbi:MAG TPA: hypothetical protein VKO61_01230 [Candidatus Paceibacterota bacterium]|nr:hypothetical protein [Candidatus Paceibacterota bacterium]
MFDEIKKTLDKGSPSEVRALFAFTKDIDQLLIAKKFRIWSRWFFPKYFEYKDASFHKEIDMGNITTYVGKNSSYLDIAGRGLAKTARTKLFLAFAIANDEERYRKHIKILSEDVSNAKQSTTDIYNTLISKRVKALYPEIFKKTELKREETMGSFTTATGVKVTSDSLRTSQRGDIQEESRPDLIWFDDFETRKTLRSAVRTKEIWDNMEEARTGLSKNGGAIYTCNYISERGNVHKLVKKIKNQSIISIEDETKERYTPAWEDRDTSEDLKELESNADDYEGEYRCKPEISKNVYFDRKSLEAQKSKKSIDEVAGLKIYKRYQPAHRIGSGHDVGGGVGLDYSTSVFIDFDQYPAQVIATYKDNEIKPDEFGHEIIRQAKRFGENYVAVEKNNHGNGTLAILKEHYDTSKLHMTKSHKPKIEQSKPKEYGWNTNAITKHTMLNDLANAVENHHIDLNDPDLIYEIKNYTRDDLMDKEDDPRLTTRHFDLIVALAIAWQTNEHIDKPEPEPEMDPWLRRAMQEEREQEESNPAL